MENNDTIENVDNTEVETRDSGQISKFKLAITSSAKNSKIKSKDDKLEKTTTEKGKNLYYIHIQL